jgi:hypothetical protein
VAINLFASSLSLSIPTVADTLLANDHPEAAALLRKQYPSAFLASDGYTALDAAIRLNALAFNK